MLKMVVEEKLAGPLSRPDILRNLEATVEIAENLDEVSARIREIPRLTTYKGGSHVAVHTRLLGGLFDMGVTRLAIVTAEEGDRS